VEPDRWPAHWYVRGTANIGLTPEGVKCGLERRRRAQARLRDGDDVRTRLTIGLALGALGLGLCVLPGVLALDESWGLGALFALRGPSPAPSSVVVIGIDRDAARALGETAELDTWSRALHARVVEQLAAAGASTIAFDLVFDDVRESAGDAAFASAIARAGNVVLAQRTETDSVDLGAGSAALVEQRIVPLADFDVAALATAPFVLPRVPVRVGQFWTFGLAAGDAPSLPVVVLQAHLLSSYEHFVDLLEAASPGATAQWPRSLAALDATGLEPTMRLIRSTFARDTGLAAAVKARLAAATVSSSTAVSLGALVDLYAGPTSRYLNFHGPARAVTTLAYDSVLAGAHSADIAGKAAFVGLTERRESAQEDDFYSIFSLPTGRNLSGVEIAATAFANLLEGRSVQPLAMPAHVALVVVFGVAFGMFVAPLSTARAAVAGGGIAFLYLSAALWLFSRHAIWLPLLVPLLGQLPAGLGFAVWRNYRALSRQRQRVHMALGHYVPRAMAERLAEQTVSLAAGRQLVHGTCLYSDAEQYTTVAEALSPSELATLMNAYYRELFRVVEEHGGEISDTAGDSMVAVWASTEPDAAARQRAAAAALAMLGAVDAFNARQPRWRLPTRIGLESGELLIGNIGAEQHYEYRAIGDIVNTAARIQDLNQELGTRVLISAATIEGTMGLRTRPLGEFLLRGKRQPVAVHEFIEGTGNGDALAAFAAALAAFRDGAWAEAEQRFAALAGQQPHDGPIRFYRELARRYRRDPPAAWAGAVPVR
jgi:adenylate cyclase